MPSDAPMLFAVPDYARAVAYDMYPGQSGQDDQQDAARHMLAAGTLARKYGPRTAMFLGKVHEAKTSPLAALRTLLGVGSMPPDYAMDMRNNRLGVELAGRARDQAELERLVMEAAERQRAQPRYAGGGVVRGAMSAAAEGMARLRALREREAVRQALIDAQLGGASRREHFYTSDQPLPVISDEAIDAELARRAAQQNKARGGLAQMKECTCDHG